MKGCYPSLKRIMKTVGCDRYELADYLFISKRTLDCKLSGTNPFTQVEMIGITDALGLTQDEFVEIFYVEAKDVLRKTNQI